jgi:hypothetical protein
MGNSDSEAAGLHNLSKNPKLCNAGRLLANRLVFQQDFCIKPPNTVCCQARPRVKRQRVPISAQSGGPEKAGTQNHVPLLSALAQVAER